MKLNLVLTAAAMSTTLMGSAFYSAPSYAQASSGNSPSSSMLFGGALLGVGFLNNNGGTQLAVGLNGGYKIAPTYSVGGYFTYQPSQASAGDSAHLLTVAAEGNYYFDEIVPGLRAGAKAGLGFGTYSPAVGEGATTTNLAIGPQIGYDYPLGGGLSIGGEGNFLYYTSSPSLNVFNILGNLKYWF